MKKEMERFELAFAEVMTSDVVPMDTMMRYVTSVQGKRLRPQLVFLSARLFGAVNDLTRRTALFVEMLHTATLIHDDVVDGSEVRRGQASVNAKWNNKSAVLAGDYLLAKAMALLSNPSDQAILKEMLAVAMAMSEGELLQAAPHRDAGSVEYLNVIERKTARLLRACCMGGALSVNASDEIINKVGDFGLNLGLVFQMRDDLLDDDSPETTAMATLLLSEYLEKALTDLDALKPYVSDQEAFASLRELTVFCAQRNS